MKKIVLFAALIATTGVSIAQTKSAVKDTAKSKSTTKAIPAKRVSHATTTAKPHAKKDSVKATPVKTATVTPVKK